MKVSVDLDTFAAFAKDGSSISAEAEQRVIAGYLQSVKISGLTL
jgi:hypothetical protein